MGYILVCPILKLWFLLGVLYIDNIFHIIGQTYGNTRDNL